MITLMFSAGILAGLLLAIGFVLLMRWGGRRGVKQYQVGGEGSVNAQGGRDVQQ